MSTSTAVPRRRPTAIVETLSSYESLVDACRIDAQARTCAIAPAERTCGVPWLEIVPMEVAGMEPESVLRSVLDRLLIASDRGGIERFRIVAGFDLLRTAASKSAPRAQPPLFA